MISSRENVGPESIEGQKEFKEHRRPVDFGFATQIGGRHERQGRENEDSLFIASPGSERLIMAVADGMSGHAQGKEASARAIQALIETMGDSAEDVTDHDLCQAIQKADQAVRTLRPKLLNIENEKGFPGTTMVVLAEIEKPSGRDWLIANVGDSRAYRIHDGQVEQLTIDQTVLEKYRAMGRKAPADIANRLTSCLGGDKSEFNMDSIDLFPVAPEPGDVIMLASDGLESGGAVSRQEMAQIAGDPDVSASQMADNLALAAAGPNSDDVSVIVIKF